MQAIKQTASKDKLVFTGLIFLILSFSVFMIPEFMTLHTADDPEFGIFFANYLLAFIYGLILLIKGGYSFGWRIFRNDVEPTMMSLILFMISAFSLNRAIPVFEESTPWVSAYLITQCVTVVLLSYREQIPGFFKSVLYFLLGSGILMYLYFALYLLPLYGIGAIGSFFFGISIHVFTPLFFLVFTILFFMKIYKEDKRSVYAFLAGIILPLLIIVGFVIQWERMKSKVDYILNKGIVDESELPLWTRLSQHLPRNGFIEKMLKTDLVYSIPSENGSWFWRIPERSFGEVKKHDPLVMIAVFLRGNISLSVEERIRVLESMYDSRHQAQERLWSGDRLETANVISNVKLFPEYRLAYTEKIISICNTEQRRFRSPQEAIYTFHLPEGGVVTSLSLWINGKEEKGILTTKAKAAEAYKTIVGVESRDPSIVQWQEGNTVSVRVFPCTSVENRRFKIGITAPLKKQSAERFIYENIYFDGPSGRNATETLKIQFTQKPQEFDIPSSFSEEATNTFLAERDYEPYWEIAFNPGKLSENTFSFDGCAYKIENFEKRYESFRPSKFYLDINNSWSEGEFNKLWSLLKDKEVYVYQNEKIKLTDENKDRLFEEFSKWNFSLFPLDQIKKPEDALLITKSTLLCPNLKDLQGSKFSDNLTPWLKRHQKLRVFNIGDTLSPYLKTLKEMRMFLYDQGSINDLTILLDKNQYASSPENDSTIAIDHTGILIKEVNEQKGATDAPDHLLRLFVYNHVMKTVSGNYFANQFIDDNVINEAQKAYIVSPVSSLIVLETQKDYERFGIEDSDNSLKNAAMKSSGAVPEPHEWLLIFLAVGTTVYLYRSFKMKQRRTDAGIE